MHKRTTPKIFARAKQLHRTMTPAEAQLWKHLRAHRMGDVHFRNQHAIGHHIVDFCAPCKKLINVNVTLNEVRVSSGFEPFGSKPLGFFAPYGRSHRTGVLR